MRVRDLKDMVSNGFGRLSYGETLPVSARSTLWKDPCSETAYFLDVGVVVTTWISPPAVYPCLLAPVTRFGKTSKSGVLPPCAFAFKFEVGAVRFSGEELFLDVYSACWDLNLEGGGWCFVWGEKLANIAKARAAARGGRRGSSKASASRHSRKRSARKWKERARRPKRAVGPYMFFCKEQHANVTADNPNIAFPEVGRILGAQWRQMSENDKKVPLNPSLHSCSISFLHIYDSLMI